MLVTDGTETIAGAMGGSGLIPSYIALGTGSSTVLSGNTALLTESDRNTLSMVDSSVAQEVTYTADFSSTEISGNTITEWGLFNAATNGSMFVREVIESIAFEGDREFQVQSTLKFSRSGAI